MPAAALEVRTQPGCRLMGGQYILILIFNTVHNIGFNEPMR